VSEEELLDETLEDGVKLRLVRRAGLCEVWRGGVRLFGEARRREDRAFAEFATAPLGGRDDLEIVLAGLGTGLLLRALLDIPGIKGVEVIERSPAVVRWCGAVLATANGGALADPRVKVTTGELRARLSAHDAPTGRFGVFLDLDATTESLSEPGNATLYDAGGVALLSSALRPGGVLAIASERREPELLRHLSQRLQNVAEIAAPVDAEPGKLDYFYRARRPAQAQARGHLPSN
jgi:spermidine synthase